MSYCLFIFSSHQHVQLMTSQILLILIDFERVFDHFLIQNCSSLNCYNSGTRRDIKKWQTAIYLIFAALSNSATKNNILFAL